MTIYIFDKISISYDIDKDSHIDTHTYNRCEYNLNISIFKFVCVCRDMGRDDFRLFTRYT